MPELTDEQLMAIADSEKRPSLKFFGTTGRSARNNNPLNIEFRPGSYQEKYGVALEPEGRFAMFPDMQSGYLAGIDQIKLDQARGHTLQSFVEKFSPPHENPTPQLVAQYSQAVGASPDTPLAQIPAEQLIVPMLARESSTRIEGMGEPSQSQGFADEELMRIADSKAAGPRLAIQEKKLTYPKPQSLGTDPMSASMGMFQSPVSVEPETIAGMAAGAAGPAAITAPLTGMTLASTGIVRRAMEGKQDTYRPTDYALMEQGLPTVSHETLKDFGVGTAYDLVGRGVARVASKIFAPAWQKGKEITELLGWAKSHKIPIPADVTGTKLGKIAENLPDIGMAGQLVQWRRQKTAEGLTNAIRQMADDAGVPPKPAFDVGQDLANVMHGLVSGTEEYTKLHQVLNAMPQERTIPLMEFKNALLSIGNHYRSDSGINEVKQGIKMLEKLVDEKKLDLELNPILKEKLISNSTFKKLISNLKEYSETYNVEKYNNLRNELYENFKLIGIPNEYAMIDKQLGKLKELKTEKEAYELALQKINNVYGWNAPKFVDTIKNIVNNDFVATPNEIKIIDQLINKGISKKGWAGGTSQTQSLADRLKGNQPKARLVGEEGNLKNEPWTGYLDDLLKYTTNEGENLGKLILGKNEAYKNAMAFMDEINPQLKLLYQTQRFKGKPTLKWEITQYQQNLEGAVDKIFDPKFANQAEILKNKLYELGREDVWETAKLAWIEKSFKKMEFMKDEQLYFDPTKYKKWFASNEKHIQNIMPENYQALKKWNGLSDMFEADIKRFKQGKLRSGTNIAASALTGGIGLGVIGPAGVAIPQGISLISALSVMPYTGFVRAWLTKTGPSTMAPVIGQAVKGAALEYRGRND